MSEGNPNKRYYVQLPGYQQGEIWDEDKYNRNKDKLFTEHKDAIVLETAPMDNAAQVGENDSYTVHLPGFPEAEVWDGAKLARNRDQLLKEHPDAEITKTTPINYWGDKLGEIHGRIDALQAELGKLPAEPDMAELRNMADEDLIQEVNRTTGKDKPGLARRRDINRELDQLYRQREANPAWQKYWESVNTGIDDDMAGLDQLQERLKQENPEAEKHYRSATRFMAGPGAGFAAAEALKSDPDYNANVESIAAARLMLRDAKNTASAPSRYGEEGGAMKDFWEGVVDGVPEALSATQLVRAGLNLHLVDAIKKIQEHERDGKATNISDLAHDSSFDSVGYLNEGEKALVKAFVKKAEVEAGRSGLISRSYQAGQGAIQSVGFMADFAMMGGIGEKAAQSVAGNLVKKAGRNELAKLGAETLYGTTKALAMTPFMPSTYSNFLNNVLQFDDAGGVDLSGKAMLKAAGDVIIENISETVGSKPLELLELPLSKIKFPDWAKAMRNSPIAGTLKQAGYNGFFEEMVEEWTGNAIRVMTGVDKDALKDFATVDQQLITAGSFAPMSLFGMPVSAVQYGVASNAMKKAGVSLDDVIGTINADENVKTAIRNLAKDTSAATPEELAHRMTDVYQQIVENGGNAEQAYKAVMDYTEAVSNYNVIDGLFEEQKDIDRSRRLVEMDSQMGNENWHHTGRNGESFVRVISDGQGNERFVYAEQNGAMSLVDRQGNKSIMSEEELAQGVQAGTLSDSGEMYLSDFLDKQTDAKKKADEQVRVEQETKEKADELARNIQPGMQVNFGTVENPENGTIIQNVGGRVVVQKSDGTTQDYSPEEIANHLGIDLAPKSDEQIRQEEIRKEEQLKDLRDMGNAYRGIQFTDPGSGEQFTMVGVTRGQSGVYAPDGTQLQSFPFDVNVKDGNGKNRTVGMDEATYSKVLQELNANRNAEQGGNQAVSEQADAAAAAQSLAETEQAQQEANEQAAEDGVPRDFRGNPLPMRMNKQTGQQVVDGTALWNKDPEAWAAWNDANPNPKVTSKERLEYTAKELAKEVEKDTKAVQKAALKGIDEDEMDRMEAELGKKLQRQELINSLVAKYNLPVEAGQTFAGEQRKAAAEQTIQEQQAGFPGIQQKWNATPKSVGAPDEIRLANGETITGHYVLTDAAAPTPSHNPSGQFKMTEGFPVDENGKTVNDRDYEHDQAAQKAVVDKAAAYDQRALQTPVIVSNDGVVLSGNDRTMASQLAAQQGTDNAYVDYLKKYPQKYGFTPEQVGQFKNPRVVFVPDEAMPYDAATFAKFNAEDKKTQNKTEKAVKAGKTISPEALGSLAALINGYDDINALYNDREGVDGLLSVMLADGIVTPEQVASLKDGDLLSGAGMDMLESTLIGASLEEEAVRLAMADRSLRKPIVTAIAQIIANNTIEGYTLRTELTDAIVLIANGKSVGEIKSGESVQDYIRQQHLFMDDVVASATVQMLADAINSRKTSLLKNVLSLYNRDAVEAANGQMSLLTNDVPTRDAILRDILEYLGYDATIIFDTSEREEEQRAAAAAEPAGAEPEEVQAGPAVQGGEGGPVTPEAKQAQYDREEVAARLEEGNVGEFQLTEYMTDDEVAEFMRLWDAFEPFNDALGDAYTRLDKDLRSSDKKVKKAAQDEINRLEQAQVDAFGPVQEFVDGLIDKYAELIQEETAAEEEAIDDELEDETEEPVEDEVDEGGDDEPRPTKKASKKGKKAGKKEKKAEQPYVVVGGASEATIAKQTYTQEEYEEFIYGYSTFSIFESKKTGERVQIYLVDDTHPIYHDHRCFVDRRLPGPNGKMSENGVYTGPHTETHTTTDYLIKYLKANKFKPVHEEGNKSYRNKPYKNKYGYWVNQHGVVMNPIRIELPSVKKGWANFNEVHLYQDDKGKWGIGGSASYGTGGGSLGGKHGPFDSKSEALRSAIDALTAFRTVHPGNNRDLRDCDNLIRTLKTKTLPQAMLEEGIVDEVQRVEIMQDGFDAGIQGDLFGAVEPEGTIEEPVAVEKPKKKETSKKKAKKTAKKSEAEPSLLDALEGTVEEPVADENEEDEERITIEDEEGTPGNFHWPSDRICTNPQIVTLPGGDRLGKVSKVSLAEKDGNWYQATFVTADGGNGSQWGSMIPTFKSNFLPYPSRSDAVKGAIEYMRFLVNDRGRKSSASYGETFNETKALIDYLIKIEVPKGEEEKKADQADAVERLGDALKKNPARVVRTLEALQDSFTPTESAEVKQILSDFREQGVSEKSKAELVSKAQELHDRMTGVEAAPEEQPAPKAEAPAYGSQNTIITTDKYEELKKRMKEKLGQLNAGFDPEVFFIGAQMAAYHVEAGARKFIDFAQRMIGDLGDAIRPYLKSIYNGARDLPGMEDFKKEMDSAADVDAIDVDGIGIEQPEAAQEQPAAEQNPSWMEKTGETAIQGFEGLTDLDIYNACDEYIEGVLRDTQLNIAQVDMIAIGSRAFGTAREDSDLDILVEYEGDVKEDAVFNALNAEPFELLGIKVDFFPIRAEQSGTLTEWLASHDNGRPVAKEEKKPVVQQVNVEGLFGALNDMAAGKRNEVKLSEFAEPVTNEIEAAREQVDTNPTEAQKEAGNYQKGHIRIQGYDITLENPKGSVRSGVDADGKPWSVTMNNDYGYIRMTEGVDGDHIDIFLSDNPFEGNVFVVDQVKEDGSFDEHKVMYGFPDEESARTAYLANYSPGWKGLGNITEVSKDEFKKWVNSSHRKTKPFAEYKSVKPVSPVGQTIGELGKYTHTKTGKEMSIVRLTGNRVSSDDFKRLKARAKQYGGYWSSFGSSKGFLFDTEEDAIKFNTLTTTDNGSENTDKQTAADTAIVVSQAASIAKQAETIAESTEPADEQKVNRTVKRIDDALEKINDQLALLGYYKAEEDVPFNEMYGYMKSSEKKAVKDADKLAKKLASDLGIEVGRKKLAKANIAPAGGDVTFRLPLNEGRELYVDIHLEPDADDSLFIRGAATGVQGLDIMYRVENPSAPGVDKYGRNYWTRYNATYDELLRGVRNAAGDYLPEESAAPVKTEGPVDVLKVVKEQAEKQQKAGKSEKKSVSSQQDGDALLGGLFDTLNDASEDTAPVEETPAPAARVKPTEVNGYKIGEKVNYTPSQGDRKTQTATIYDFEYDGRPVLDSGLAPVLYEVVDWEQISKIEQEPVNDTNDGLQRNDELRPEGMPADGVRPGGAEEETTGGNGAVAGQEGGRTDTGAAGEGERTDRDSRHRPASAVKRNTRNNRVAKGEVVFPKTPAARYKANVAAIRLLKELQDSGKDATKEQMAVLRQYTGWGGLGGYFNNQYSPEYRELKSLLTDEEMQTAEMSINTAYYTPTEIIDSMWDIAKRLGFEGGTVLEGSAGIGNILASMPKSMSEQSEITAVELDNLTGGILEKLYPDANVLIKGFEEADIPNNSVDLAITNVPFGNNISVYDAKEKDLTRKFGGKIHDFCIAKNVRKLREGGIGIFISTRGTLDGSSKALRQWIVNEGGSDVIGAFRLNNETFEGTGATSDIIVIRKRVNGKVSPDAIDVTDTEITRREDFELNETEWNPKTRSFERIKGKAAMEINAYFVQHPENMGGEMGFGFEHKDSYRPGSTALWPSEKIDQNKRLVKWAKQFKALEDAPVAQATGQQANEDTHAVKEGQLVTNSKGEICVSRSGKAIPIGANAQKIKGKYTKAQALADYDELKNAIDEALQYQLNNESDEGLKPLLDKLNRAYDNFVRKYGNLNKNVAISFLRNDVDFSATAAVEDYKETKDIHGKVTAKTKKTSIFSGRVLGAKRIPTPTTAKDGVIASINLYGRIDVPFIANSLKKDEDAVRKEILSTGLGFENPLTGELEVEYEYLSGNVREKLEYAREHNEDGKYDKNIEALQKVVPADIPAHLIEFSLGSDWLPVELYAKFARERFDINEDKFGLSNLGGTWVVSENEWEFAANNEKNRAAGVHSEALRMDKKGHELMIAAMNNTSVVFSKTFKDYDGTTHTETDKVATQSATAKMSEMRDDFKEWARAKMLEEPELAGRIAKTYNDTFNAIVPKEIRDTFVPEHFEGQVLEMGGKPFHLYPHQSKAVIRATTEPLMMAHEVGAGKTFTLITTAMEMRRLGTAKKPMIVVQNSTLGQFVSSAKALYPNAKVLTISESDRTLEGRSAFYAKIKYNDWDIIIVPQSVFEMMPDSEERQRAFIQEKIEEKKFILEQAKEAKNNNETRRLEKELADLEYEYQYGEKPPKKGGKRDAKKEAEAIANATAKAKKQLDRRTDEVSDFDDMGIDALLVDEAHSYKHLGFSTAMQRGVKGVDATGSKKAAGVYLKTRAVFDKVGWKNVVFATGTPISNTAAEIWTFMKYLMPADKMRQNHIYYFDDFVRNFGNISQSLEFTTSGKFKENTRFAAYTNLPELIRIWSSVTDTVLTKDAQAAKSAEGVTETLEDKLPKMANWTDDKGAEHVNQARDIYLPQSPSLVDIMNAIRAKLEWYENLSGKEKKENSYIPLTMFGLAKMAAIDPRLVDRNAIDEPNSKTNMAVRETLKALEDSKDYKGTCALFSDNFRRWDDVNGKRVEGFNIFEEIRRKLIDAGVPDDQIVIMKSGMTTAAKEKIFARVNAGDVRVIMGTTATLGTGVNIQERLFFEAHIDAPNRPMDYTQRTGRILRQGNLHKDWGVPVRVVRFGVEDSLDVTAYQRLSTKSKFINSVMDGKPLIANGMDNRVLEEEEEGEFDNPVAVLSGSEYALLKSQAERELRKLRNKKEQHRQDQIYIDRTLKENGNRIAYNGKLIEEDKKHLAAVKDAFPDGKVKEIAIEGRKVKTPEQIAETVKDKITAPVRERIERRRNDYGFSTEKLTYNISFDGMPVEVAVTITRANEFNDRTRDFRITMRSLLEYSCPRLGIEDKLVPGGYNSIKDLVTEFADYVATGKMFENNIRNLENTNARLESDNALMSERRGKPFADEDKLKKQEEVVKDYTEKMRAEMAEKEAKYADMAKNAKTSFNLDDVDIEDEDNGDESVHNRETEEDSGERIDLSNPLEVARVSAAIGNLAKRLGVKVNIERGDPDGSKGYYVEGQDSVTINIARAESLSDAIDTLLHEAVGHYGLRQLFGNEHALRRFINDMLRNAPEQIRNEIASLASENGWDMDYAAEEYLAEMAVNVNKSRAERSLWRRIVDAINDFISTIVGAPVRVNETSVANMFNEVGLENLMRRSFTNLEESARRNEPVQRESESDTDFASRCMDEIGKRGYNLIAKARFVYKAKENSPAGDYDRGKDILRIFATPGFLYGDYEDTFFHENLHAFLYKNGYDGDSKGVSDFVDFCRELNPDVMKGREDALESTGEYEGINKNEELFVLGVEDMMREGSPSVVLPRLTEDSRSLISEYFNQIGYEIQREATARGEGRVEDGQKEVGSGDARLRTGEEVRPSGGSEGEGELGEVDSPRIHYRVRTKPAPKKTGIGYKVFYRGRDGKLYPPMVNPTGEATPVGVWLDAEIGQPAGESKTGRKKVKAGGKGTQGGSGTLAFRPGWHLGEIPYALQFNRGEKVDNPLGITNQKGEVIKVGKYFPRNFVWGEVEYAMDEDYQDEAMSYGYNRNGNFEHSKAGLPRIPEDGYYTYRTNANPATDPWIITGAMKVNRILTDDEVDKLVRDAGREPQLREAPADEGGRIAKGLLDRYDNQDGNAYPWLSESEFVDMVERELPRNRETDAIFSAIEQYRSLVDEDFNEGRRDFSGGEMGDLFDDFLTMLRGYADGKPLRNRRAGVEGFISNARAAVDAIPMEKATPQQWLKMIESRGGLKAGEDKWVGLSEWLKSTDAKTLTKSQVAEYIDVNGVEILESHYTEEGDEEAVERNHPGFNHAYFVDQDVHGEPYIDGINSLEKAIEIYNRENDDKIEPGALITDEEYDKLLDYGEEMIKDFRRINATRLRYTTVGLQDKREIALWVPFIESWNSDDNIHFGDAGVGRAIAWARFGDAFIDEEVKVRPEDKEELERLNKKVKDAFEKAGQEPSAENTQAFLAARDERDAFAGRTGARGGIRRKKVLFIDEIQSKRHQEGREHGYKKDLTAEDVERIENARSIANHRNLMEREAHQKLMDAIQPFKDKYLRDEITSQEYDDAVRSPEIVSLNEEYKTLFKEATDAQDELTRVLNEYTMVGVPKAPFEKNWHELTMKRMLRYAAENGYDYVAWTRGDQQAERYNLGGVLKNIEVSKYKDGDWRLGFSFVDGHYDDAFFNKDGICHGGGMFNGKPMSEVVGKEIAERIMNREVPRGVKYSDSSLADLYDINGDGLRIGGEGMRGFYDKILPAFMNKYGKKWGVHVEDISLPNLISENGEKGVVAHAVPVTPEMRESVMQGQLMFRQGEVSEPSPVSYKESMGAKRLAVNETATKCGIDIEFKPSSEMRFMGKPLAGRWLNGKMYICLEHCRDNDDAVRTVLHEGVGHNGLRRLIGDENMTDFCLELFGKLPEDARRKIAADAVSKYGGDTAESVEEYLAERAEVMDFENGDYERNFWDIVRDALRRVLAKVGINVPLSERDVRWLMWQSYNANKQTDILNEAKRQVVANKLGFTLTQQADKAEAVKLSRNRIAEQVLAPAARIYNKDVLYWMNRLHETWVDKDDSVHRLVNAIEKATGKAAKAFEDVRLALNQQSSKGLAAIEKFEREYYEPMKAAIKSIMQEKGYDLKDVERYVMIKHGLERNEVFAQRDAREYYQDIHDKAVKVIKDAEIGQDEKDRLVAKEDAKLQRHFDDIANKTDRKYKELRKNDYGGLTAMYSEWDDFEPFMEGVESWEEYQARVLRARHPKFVYIDEEGREQVDMEATEDAARQEVFEFENGSKAGVDELWKRINAATKSTLKHQYDANMLGREQYLHVRDMFKYYVPLRGFADNTAEDMYDYYRSDQRNDFTPPLLKAKGRKTEAESPFGYIGSMASSGIAADMKNETKLALYYFVNNRANNDLVTISDVWYKNTGVDELGRKIFTPVYPPLNEELNTQESRKAYEDWEKQMQEEAKAGFAFKGGRKLNLRNSVIHIDDRQKTSHIIKFKVGGRDMMMYINGNPRAAQAINNELNVEMSADYQRFFGKILRWFSGINTSYNPEFWLSNAQRDALFALMSVDVKEDSEYGKAFRRNFGSLIGRTLIPGRKGGAYSLKRKLDSGQLGDEKMDRLYKEFVENGGVTGYTTLKNNEEWELELRKYTGEQKKAVEAVKTAFGVVQDFGEAIEQMTRFAAYVTSRDMGKEIKDAVNDAKELTVNFNRKGSGKAISFKEAERLRTKDGKKLNPVQKAFVVAASWLPVYGRRFIMFFNASTQGLNAMYKLYKKNGKKMGAWTAGYLALGVVQALIHAMLDDDDDYLDIPDYERRNNLLLGGKGAYFKWALPQEMRVFYSLGDMVVNHAMGREPNKSIAGELLASVSDIAPLNPSGGLAAVAPSALTPVVEVALNRDYKGAKIFNDLRYLSDEERKRTPAYQRAYQGTGKVYILLSQFANWLSGGDYADAGWLNINPAAVEHIMKGATGGAGTTLGKLYRGTVGQVLGEDFTVRNTPFLSRILTINDDRYRNAHTTELFDYYKAEAEHTKKLINTYRNNGDDRKLERIIEGKDYEIMTIYDSYRKMLEWYNDELKYTTDKKERKALMREQDAIRKEMIQEISNIGNDD